MGKTRFYLEPSNKDGFSLVMMVYHANGRRFRYATKLNTQKDLWDIKRQRFSANAPNEKENNSILDNLVDSISRIEREALFFGKEYSIDEIKEQFLATRSTKKERASFHETFEDYITHSQHIKKPTTVKSIRCSFSKLLLFEKQKNFKLRFDKLDETFYEEYIRFLIVDCKHLNNSVGRYIKDLKSFLNYATSIRRNTNLKFMKFKKFVEEIDIIYHTGEELHKLFSLQDLSEPLNIVRENYCLACFTGLRFSDVVQLRNEHVKGDMIEMRSQKTKDKLVIPLNDFAKEIFKRNSGKYLDRPLPPCFSNQKTNAYLKELGKKAKINESIMMTSFSGSKKIEDYYLKYDLMCTHTARRTFITLSLEKGMRPEIVMQITGHKKWETFKRYIKITDKVKIHEMNDKWNKSHLKAV